MNNAAKNIHIQVFVGMHVFISLGKIPRSEIVGSYNKIRAFYEIVKLFSKVAVLSYISISNIGTFPFLLILTKICY